MPRYFFTRTFLHISRPLSHFVLLAPNKMGHSASRERPRVWLQMPHNDGMWVPCEKKNRLHMIMNLVSKNNKSTMGIIVHHLPLISSEWPTQCEAINARDKFLQEWRHMRRTLYGVTVVQKADGVRYIEVPAYRVEVSHESSEEEAEENTPLRQGEVFTPKRTSLRNGEPRPAGQ